MMSQAILSLGSNIGNRVSKLNSASQKIQKQCGKLISESAIYESAPWGFKAIQLFLNQVLKIDTDLNPENLLQILLHIETELGRQRNSNGYESRSIDIDILFYDQLILASDDLKVPHPHLQDRRFILVPLNEICPDMIHPILKKPMKQLLMECRDKLWVKKFIQ